MKSCLLSIVALASVAGAATAAADVPKRFAYQDELQRCVDQLRPELNLREGDRVMHFLDDTSRRGQWYRFELETTVTDEAGTVVVEGLKVNCRANRWDSRTELDYKLLAEPLRTARR